MKISIEYCTLFEKSKLKRHAQPGEVVRLLRASW
jgi:hypothetical protein